MMVRIHHMAVDSKGSIFVAALGQASKNSGKASKNLFLTPVDLSPPACYKWPIHNNLRQFIGARLRWVT
jgi:hypothetical protein